VIFSSSGFWRDDKKEGSGSYFWVSTGKVLVGEWVDDIPKSGVYMKAGENPDMSENEK
jgi:hypothetical protein